MARKKKADQAKKVLGKFEGADVVGTSLILRNTGDGLSKAMEVEPATLHVGDVVSFGGEGEVVGVRYDSAGEGTDDLIRVHIIRAGVVMLVDADVLSEAIDAQKLAIEKLEGVERLPFAEGDEADGDDEPPRRDLSAVK